MGQLRPLIKNQKLRIDNHQRGKESGWGTGLHIHKTFTDGRHGGVQVLVPFDHDGNIDIRPKERTTSSDLNSIKKEIAHALEKGQKRTEFVKDIAAAIERFSGGAATEENCREAAKRIAEHFGLDEEIIKEIVHRYQGRLVRYRSYHIDPHDYSYYSIVQDAKQVAISPRKRRP